MRRKAAGITPLCLRGSDLFAATNELAPSFCTARFSAAPGQQEGEHQRGEGSAAEATAQSRARRLQTLGVVLDDALQVEREGRAVATLRSVGEAGFGRVGIERDPLRAFKCRFGE